MKKFVRSITVSEKDKMILKLSELRVVAVRKREAKDYCDFVD